MYVVLVPTACEYISNTAYAGFFELWDCQGAHLQCPNDAKSMDMAVGLLDSLHLLDWWREEKQQFETVHSSRQGHVYDVHCKKQCFGALVWMDAFELFIHVDYSCTGASFDKGNVNAYVYILKSI